MKLGNLAGNYLGENVRTLNSRLWPSSTSIAALLTLAHGLKHARPYQSGPASPMPPLQRTQYSQQSSWLPSAYETLLWRNRVKSRHSEVRRPIVIMAKGLLISKRLSGLMQETWFQLLAPSQKLDVTCCSEYTRILRRLCQHGLGLSPLIVPTSSVVSIPALARPTRRLLCNQWVRGSGCRCPLTIIRSFTSSPREPRTVMLPSPTLPQHGHPFLVCLIQPGNHHPRSKTSRSTW